VTLHFMHIGKTGGTAIKHALRRPGLAYWHFEDAHKVPETPYGRIQLHHHRFRLRDVPADDYVFFCVRDPISRFLSAFYSRLRKGQPRYYVEWSPAERQAFEAFPTAQRLAVALLSDDEEERVLAQTSMGEIRHLASIERYLGSPRQLRKGLSRVVYIATQETLLRDWEQIKSLLELPAEAKLPSGPKRSHRRDPALEATLDDVALSALRAWYARDFRLVRYCNHVRTRRGWGAGPVPLAGPERLRREAERMRAIAAMALPPLPSRGRRMRSR
jgi:hypothetical protein